MQNIPDCFRFLFEKYGRDILLNEKKFYALLTDYLPTKEKELKILKIACNAGVYKDFAEVEESRYTIQKKKAIKILTDDYLLGEEWAEMAIGWLMEALGEQPTPTIPKKETVKSKQVKIQAIADFDNYILEIVKDTLIKCTCLKATIVRLPDDVKVIGENAFSNCGRLLGVELPNKLEVIRANAFLKRKSLTCIKIPVSCIEIQERAFMECDNLKNVIYEGTAHGWSQIRFGWAFITSYKLFVSDKELKTVCLEDVALIRDYAFTHCRSIEKVIIRNKVSYIGANAFFHCEELTVLIIDGNKAIIGNHAFFDCSKLKTLEIGDGVVAIEHSAFYDCDSLKQVKLGKNLKKIGNSAFNGCGLVYLDIPDSVVEIGESAFHWCEKLKRIVIRKNVKWIGEKAFAECDNLTIYCEAPYKPQGWDDNWNISNCPVVWGYKENTEIRD